MQVSLTIRVPFVCFLSPCPCSQVFYFPSEQFTTTPKFLVSPARKGQGMLWQCVNLAANRRGGGGPRPTWIKDTCHDLTLKCSPDLPTFTETSRDLNQSPPLSFLTEMSSLQASLWTDTKVKHSGNNGSN